MRAPSLVFASDPFYESEAARHKMVAVAAFACDAPAPNALCYSGGSLRIAKGNAVVTRADLDLTCNPNANHVVVIGCGSQQGVGGSGVNPGEAANAVFSDRRELRKPLAISPDGLQKLRRRNGRRRHVNPALQGLLQEPIKPCRRDRRMAHARRTQRHYEACDGTD